MGSLRSLMRRERPEPITPPIPSDEEVIRAVYLGMIRKLKALLIRGANPNAMDWNCESALGIAVLEGELGMMDLLVRHGADLGQRNACGFTPLHLAASSSLQTLAPKICNFLLDHGANVNASNSYALTPLMLAVDAREFDSARLLLERGADATLKNADGLIALDLLRRGKGSAAMRRLLENVS